MDFAAILDSLPTYASGALVTLELTFGALLVGMIFAVPLSIARGARARWVAAAVWAFTYVIRGTPLLVQLFLLYFGLAQFEWVRASAL